MLQFITDDNTADGTSRQAMAALEGGCRWIQIRMKEALEDEVETAINTILPICRQKGATLIIDDRVQLAKLTGADGVHLGKKDMAPEEARRILGKDKIIGATINSIDDIRNLNLDSIDYLGAGPFRFTTTKKQLDPTLGLEGYRRIMTYIQEYSDLPIVAIGGITLSDIQEIMETGVTGIAISGAITRAEDPVETTRNIIKKLSIPKK